MPRSPMQRGSGYPGTWELSNVTRWVNHEICYVERTEAIHSAATPFLKRSGKDNLPVGG
jgi:hypothetical protein